MVNIQEGIYMKIFVSVILILIALSCTAYGAAILPKKGDIAVLVEGEDEQQTKIAEIQIINSLIAHGYRVVDEKKMQAMKLAATQSRARELARQGNFSAIFKLNASYSVGATIYARIQAGQPVQNQFGFYTGDATAVITAAASGGITLGGRIAMTKQHGGTTYETQIKAIQAAVDDGMSQIY